MKTKAIKQSGRFFLLWLAGMLLTVQAFAQEITVNGNVKDNLGETVIGASVVIKGTANGTITDFDGNFSLKAKKGDIIVISFIGYKTQELPAAANMSVVLQDDSQLLDDVVVIGYGSVKKSDLSGSVVAIKAEEMNRGAVTSPQELLMGKVPGLSISQPDGQPGGGSTIRIRQGSSLNASNDPLIVIDGIPVANDAAPGTPSALGTINPNDIETFTVLKDASATAIYGSRASNGVIIITTKKGTQDKLKVTYSSTYTLRNPYNRMNTMDAATYREVMTNFWGTESSVYNLLNQYPDQATDWQDEIFQNGLATDQNISVSGKAGFLPFRVSFGYNKERGTLKTSDYERYTGSISLSPKFFDEHLSVDINVKGTINNNTFADSGAVGGAAYFDPTKPVNSTDGSYNGWWQWTGTTLAGHNPLSLLYDVNNAGTTKRSLGNIQLDYKIHGLEDLRVNLNLGYDVAMTDGDNYDVPNSYRTSTNTNFPNYGGGATWHNLRRNQLLDFYLNYQKQIDAIKSHVDVTAGYSYQHFYFADLNTNRSNVMPERDTAVSGYEYNEEEQRYYSTTDYRKPYEYYLISFFARLNYNLMDRYLLTATVRRDGSSRFSEDNRWGIFPSAAVAWSIINEPFMEKTHNWLSNLKLRLGYGKTGQQEISSYYGYLGTYTTNTDPHSTYFGHQLMKPDGYNPNLKWETTTTYNVAIDYGFLNNRINGSIEFYKKDTKDLLNTVASAAGTNFNTELTANVGSMENKGVEFNVNAMAIQTKDFSWELNYNITWNDSKITQLTATPNPDYGMAVGDRQRNQVGYIPNAFYVYQQVYDQNGNPIQNALVDRNNNGSITEDDRYISDKSPVAKVYMGLSSQFIYKNWDLGFNLRASLGNYVYNGTFADNATLMNYSDQGFLSNLYADCLKTGWTAISSNEQKRSDYFLENASYLKMDNITLGYSFNNFTPAKLSGRISASVQNVFTITKYSGLDPECSAIDGSSWPRPRTFTLGLTLNF